VEQGHSIQDWFISWFTETTKYDNDYNTSWTIEYTQSIAIKKDEQIVIHPKEVANFDVLPYADKLKDGEFYYKSKRSPLRLHNTTSIISFISKAIPTIQIDGEMPKVYLSIHKKQQGEHPQNIHPFD